MRSLARAAAVLAVLAQLLLAGGLTGATAPANAHAARVGADPAPDSTLQRGPTTVSATFDEPLQAGFAAMTVVGPDGNLWSDGTATVAGTVVSVPVRRPFGPVGRYAVNYRVTSADGHVVSGSWTFRLSEAGGGTPGPSAGDAAKYDDGSPTVWPFVAAAIVVVGAGAWWTLRRRR